MTEKEDAVYKLFCSQNLTIISVLVDVGYIDKDLFMKNVCTLLNKHNADESFHHDLFNYINETWGFDVDSDKEIISGFLERIIEQLYGTDEIERYKLLVDYGGCIREVHNLAFISFEVLTYYVERRTFTLTDEFIECGMFSDDTNVIEWTMNLWDETDVVIDDCFCVSILSRSYFSRKLFFPKVLQKFREHNAVDVAIFNLVRGSPKNLEDIITYTQGLVIHDTLLLFAAALLDDNVCAKTIYDNLAKLAHEHINEPTRKQLYHKFIEDVSAIC